MGTSKLACSRLSIGGSERKQRRENQAIQGERAGARGLWEVCQGNLTKCWNVTYDGLAYHPGGVAILLVASCYMYGSWDNLCQSWTTRLARLNTLSTTDFLEILFLPLFPHPSNLTL